MSGLDWIVLSLFTGFVVVYGSWKTRGSKDVKEYLLANKSTAWFTIVLSIMATQASAITFLSTPGQAYVDGMRFVQFYLGLPLAMIILSITAVPIYHRLKVYTAYEYLENRFDLKNRALGSLLFLTQRGLAAGLTIFAPALILSVILGWNLQLTILIVGALVIIYTAIGGTRAVNQTHIYQMAIVMSGMLGAFFMIFYLMPPDISFFDATRLAGKMGRLNAIDFTFDLGNRYNFWSGMLGGTFLMLSYFGTDQSQVQRYLSGRSVAQSRIGLLMNGLLKVPMQFFILFLGVMVLIFYQFVTPPIFFNPGDVEKVRGSSFAQEYRQLETEYQQVHERKQSDIRELLRTMDNGNEAEIDLSAEKLSATRQEELAIRSQGVGLIRQADPASPPNDTNYIFLNFVIHFLPRGLIGLVIAAILSASMSSTSAELNALASTSVIDIYKRLIKKNGSEKHYLVASKAATVFWGIFAIGFAEFANRLGTLIEAVNVLGSLFYGTILGIFLVAFYFKRIGGSATFYSAIVAELMVLYCHFSVFINHYISFAPKIEISFLWYNLIGCAGVIIFAVILNPFFKPGT